MRTDRIDRELHDIRPFELKLEGGLGEDSETSQLADMFFFVLFFLPFKYTLLLLLWFCLLLNMFFSNIIISSIILFVCYYDWFCPPVISPLDKHVLSLDGFELCIEWWVELTD